MVIEAIDPPDCKSTCHHGLASRLVAVTEFWKKLPSTKPSTATAATGEPGIVLLWLAGFPNAIDGGPTATARGMGRWLKEVIGTNDTIAANRNVAEDSLPSFIGSPSLTPRF